MATAASQSGPPEERSGSVDAFRTIFPQRKILVRTLEQQGTICPAAQAELYARTSGYLKLIQRETTPQLASALLADQLAALSGAPAGSMVARAASLAAAAQAGVWLAPQKDIGSFVRAGELLLVIDVPELLQEVAQKDSIRKQRVAELEEASTTIAACVAAAETAQAREKQAEADIRKADADCDFYNKQLERLKELVRRETISPEVADEKLHQVRAAQAALEACKAKSQAARAELSIASSKLATARADLRVKEAQVEVAEEELQRAEIQAEFTQLQAPFDGVITFRGVDEGDFIQNSTTGQTRLLMTVTSLDRVKVVVQVPERDALWVHAGAEATVHVDARTRWEVKGRVSRINHSVDPQTRSMRVEIDLPNPDHQLLPGMNGQVRLTEQHPEDTCAIPTAAVYGQEGATYILQMDRGVVRRHRVRITYDDGEEVAVVKVSGGREAPLTGSEELVVGCQTDLRDGQCVEAAAMSGP